MPTLLSPLDVLLSIFYIFYIKYLISLASAVMNIVNYNINIADKKRRAFATFSAEYKLSLINSEIFLDNEIAILRLKN